MPTLESDLEKIRYKVFKDLWSKGYYLTCGMKFGGDFLVYKGYIHNTLIIDHLQLLSYFNFFSLGDPSAHHATFIVNCRDLDEQIMVSSSRVGSMTKKKMVLAKDDGGSLKYLIYHLEDT